MERSKGEDTIADNNGGGASTLAKRKRPAIDDAASSGSSPGGGVCNDDTVENILARLPARTAIACTALSKHHRRLIRSPEFRSLHCRLGAPLPSPHVAYLATAPITRRAKKEDPASGYYGFHLAGPGLTGNGNSPIRSLAGWKYLGTTYVNTCNGVLLLATKGFSDPCHCTLWNPAVADAAREATISEPSWPNSEDEDEEETTSPIVLSDGRELSHKETQFLALGLGYGRRSNTYKLLLCRRDTYQIQMFIRHDGKIIGRRTGGSTHHSDYSLVVHTLGGGDMAADKETLPLRTVVSMETVQSSWEQLDEKIIRQKSLYMDGTIYFLHLQNYEILAFDVDDDTVRTIDMPTKHQEADGRRSLALIEMSGRPCLVITENDRVALWLLTVNYQLEPMHVISYEMIRDYYSHKVSGVWDCGGILLLWFGCPSIDELLLYDVTAKKIFRADMPRDLTVNKSDYMLCWGYKPTLVSPESIVVEFNQDMEPWRGRSSAHITEAINPLLLQDRRKGQKTTLNIVCLMEFLVHVMQKLPHDLQDMVEMPKMDRFRGTRFTISSVRCLFRLIDK